MEEEDLEGFYRWFVRSRIQGVRVGAKCTVMVYRPTGSGKIHTMFGCARQPGIVYRALRDILEGGIGSEGDSTEDDAGLFVHVTVLEIYNEEVYDLLVGSEAATKGNAPSLGSLQDGVRPWGEHLLVEEAVVPNQAINMRS